MAQRNTAGPVYYTTFQVAKHLGVSLPTVVNWVDSGRISGHRTLGGHRRIAHNDVVAFAREHDYPLSRALRSAGHGGKRVLVVDDEVDFADMVREYLHVKGDFQVHVATTGFQAGFMLARFTPDLVLMDLMTQGIDAAEVKRVLREDPDTKHVPVIACTAYRDPQSDLSAVAADLDGSIDKPLKLDDLLALVREMLGL